MVTDLFKGRDTQALFPQVAEAPALGDAVYFPAGDTQQGQELWRSDGTAAGTRRVTDICPGRCDSNAGVIAVLGGDLYLLADDGERGIGLWRTDGQPDHEQRVDGVCDAACINGLQLSSRSWRGVLYFLEPGSTAGAGAPQQDEVLWTTDFTAAGTHAVAALCGDLGVCAASPDTLFLGGPDPSGQALLVLIERGAAGGPPQLWRTDGTAGGTALLHTFAGKETAFNLFPPAGELFFFADGSDLWASDGTAAGTHLVRSLAGLIGSLDFLAVPEQKWVDGVWYAIFEGGGEWLRSDGTAAGTAVLGTFRDSTSVRLAHRGSTVLAFADDGIYRAGTSAADTVRIFSWPGEAVQGAVEGPQEIFVLLYMANGPRIWATDGTAAGTFRVTLPAALPLDQFELTGLPSGGVLFTRGSSQLWAVDATGRQAAELHDLEEADGSSLTALQSAAVVNGRLLFFATSADGKDELYASNGTAAGTTAVDAGTVGPKPAVPGNLNLESLTAFDGGRLALFSTSGDALWVSDGSAHGTRPLFRGGALAPRAYTAIAPLGQSLLFAGIRLSEPSNCGPGDAEPWITDGSPSHTREVKDLNPFFYDGGGSQCEGLPLPSNPGPGVEAGGRVYFAADDLVHGRELFASDGTAAGTQLVADIDAATVPNTVTDPPGVPPNMGVGSDPQDLVALGSQVAFTADDGSHGRQLWITNGTARGTRQVDGRLGAGDDGSAPHDLVVWRGAVYYIAKLRGGEGLWRSNGTAAGTALVSDLQPGGVVTLRATQLVAAPRRLYFAAFNEATGTELWSSAGSEATTGLVADLWPGERGSEPQGFAVVGGVLVFAADDGVTGMEAWRSDGTAAGTWRLGDIAPGVASSNPGPFWVLGSQVLFGADDGTHGRELWALPVSAVASGGPP